MTDKMPVDFFTKIVEPDDDREKGPKTEAAEGSIDSDPFLSLNQQEFLMVMRYLEIHISTLGILVDAEIRKTEGASEDSEATRETLRVLWIRLQKTHPDIAQMLLQMVQDIRNRTQVQTQIVEALRNPIKTKAIGVAIKQDLEMESAYKEIKAAYAAKNPGVETAQKIELFQLLADKFGRDMTQSPQRFVNYLNFFRQHNLI